MPEQDRVAAQTVGEDGSRQRYHQGDYPHIIPADLNEAEEQTLKLHRASIHAPTARSRFGTDEDGNPIEVGAAGLIVTDPATGAVEPLTEESAARAEKIQAFRAKQAEARYEAGAPGAAVPPLPEELQRRKAERSGQARGERKPREETPPKPETPAPPPVAGSSPPPPKRPS
jgi:hypothetical protein